MPTALGQSKSPADQLAIHGGTPVLTQAEHGTWPRVEAEERAAVLEVLDRGILSGGSAPAARAFERAFGEAVGAPHVLLTHSGTSALQVAVAALGIQAGDEVIVPSYSFVATAVAVMNQGAVPVFVDVDPESGNIDPARIEAAITERTRAIMPVHVHGCPADLDEILAIADARGLHVIEDAAQAHLATYKGRPVGAIGVASGFSLQSSKNLSAGEGGVFCTRDQAVMELADRARNFGQDLFLVDRDKFDATRPLDGGRPHVSLMPGHMFRGNEMMAAFALAQLRKLPERTLHAQENAERLSAALEAIPGVRAQRVPSDRKSVHHKFRVHLDPSELGLDVAPRAFRDAVQRALVAEGVNAVLWQDHTLPEHPLFVRREGFGHGFPFSLNGEITAAPSQAPERFPNARTLLDTSLVLFSQTRPLIAQPAAVVDKYAEAIAKVMAQPDALRALAAGA
ncbi:MAG: DegT/DnrJ/EryC1/StrS family aminotransferase [Sandaracinaceae bacterium]